MTDYKSEVIQILDKYKCKSPADEWRAIPIQSEKGIIGFLKPVTFSYKLICPKYIHLVCLWRMENPIGFANTFQGSIQKTEYWFDNVLLPREDRILFFVYSFLKSDPIGHLGLSSFNFEKKSCEIDNVVRGKKDEKGLMTLATQTLISWAKRTLLVTDIYLRVLSDNNHAITFYQRLGFERQRNIPLYKVETPDITEWVEDHNNEMNGVKPDRYYTYMKLCK
jgi:perosamine synthetase